MPLVNAYCQVADVRGQLGDDGAVLDTTIVERAINATSRAIDRYTGRRFWQDSAPVARLYAAECRRSLEVGDISAMAGLVVEVDPGGDGVWTGLTAGDYHLEPLNADADGGAYAWRRVVVDDGDPLPVSSRPLVRVTARWGWSLVPDEVNQAAVLKATGLFKRKDAPFGIAGFSDFGAVRISRQDPDVISLLQPFVLPGVA